MFISEALQSFKTATVMILNFFYKVQKKKHTDLFLFYTKQSIYLDVCFVLAL